MQLQVDFSEHLHPKVRDADAAPHTEQWYVNHFYPEQRRAGLSSSDISWDVSAVPANLCTFWYSSPAVVAPRETTTHQILGTQVWAHPAGASTKPLHSVCPALESVSRDCTDRTNTSLVLQGLGFSHTH